MAGRIALDLKQFKHVKSDDSSSTLQHKDGHVLTIAHKPLNKEFREQLKALAKMDDNSKKPADKAEAKQDAQRLEMASGGEIKKYADGTPDEPIKVPEVEQKQSLPPPPPAAVPIESDLDAAAKALKANQSSSSGIMDSISKGADYVANLYNPEKYPEIAKDAEITKKAIELGVDPQALRNQINEIKTQKAAAQASQSPTPGMPTMPTLPQGPAEQPMANQMQNGQQHIQQQMPGSLDLQNVENMMQSGYQSKLKGISKQQESAQNLGEEQASLLNDAVKAQSDAKIAFNEQYNRLDAERKAHIEDIKAGHIDPNKYWVGDKDGNGSHSKIAAGIGMILAGFNPTSRPNAAIEFLNQQMDRNLQAQKENLNSDQNLLAANLKQFGNLKDATDMTRMMQMDLVHNELLAAASKAQSPMAKAAALQAAGQLQMESAPLFQNFAMRRAMMSLANGANSGDPSNTAAAEQMIAYARMTDPEKAKEMESRLVPHVGMATIPVPPEIRQKLTAHQNLASAATELQSFIKSHGGLWNRMSPDDRAKAAALVLPVQAAFREGTLGTVYREGEQPLLDKAVKGQPLDFASYIVNTEPTKIKTLLESNLRQANILKANYGLPVSRGSSNSQSTSHSKFNFKPIGK